jgi:hypothetical protein
MERMKVSANALTILLRLQWITIRDQAFGEGLGQSVGSEKSGKPRGWFGNIPVGEDCDDQSPL